MRFEHNAVTAGMSAAPVRGRRCRRRVASGGTAPTPDVARTPPGGKCAATPSGMCAFERSLDASRVMAAAMAYANSVAGAASSGDGALLARACDSSSVKRRERRARGDSRRAARAAKAEDATRGAPMEGRCNTAGATVERAERGRRGNAVAMRGNTCSRRVIAAALLPPPAPLLLPLRASSKKGAASAPAPLDRRAVWCASSTASTAS